ncbi:MAG: translation initiation factor IF-2 N-terminal domain-containing protein, partial [Bacteroidota bacterium]
MPTTRRARSNKPKSVRLFKALRELNVAAETVVEHLQEKGFDLDDKLQAGDPNAKLAPEMYDALIEAYSDDADAKARVRERREQIAAAQEVADDEPARVTTEALAEPEPETVPVAPAEPVIETPEAEAPVAPAEPVIETPEPVAEEVPEPEPAAEPVAETPEPEPEPAAEPVAEAPEPEPEVAEAADTPEAAEETDAVAETPEASDEDAVDPQAVEDGTLDADTPTPAADAEGVVRADRYALEGTKVLGKIDLSGLESGRKRKRKSKGAADAPASGGDSKRSRKKGKKGRPSVDKAEVEKNLAKTKQATAGRGGKRVRQKRRRARRDERAAQRELLEQLREEQSSILRVMEFISTGDLAEAMNVNVAEVISKGFAMGMMFSINQRLDADQITLLADEFDFEVEFMNEDEDVLDIVE